MPDQQQQDRPSRPKVLRIDASGRYADSVSRRLVDRLVDRLRGQHPGADVIVRDLSATAAEGCLPFVDEALIEAYYTPEHDRSEQQRASLAVSDRLVDELADADVVVIGTPIYNFSLPASLKAYVDLVARLGRTFDYIEGATTGLLRDRPAYVVVTSGGVPVGSAVDFASGYLRHVLRFLGINDVRVIAADRLLVDGSTRRADAEAHIDKLTVAA
jgi:FMN-dependent NADH-azoreductase